MLEVWHWGLVGSTQRFIYYPVPKVACSSIKRALWKHFGLDVAEHECPHMIDWERCPLELFSSRFPGYFGFAFVRNPWDRLVSVYEDKIRQQPSRYRPVDGVPFIFEGLPCSSMFRVGMDFDTFVRAVCETQDVVAEPHIRSQSAFLTIEGVVQVAGIYKFEAISEDWGELQARFGFGTLGHFNRSNRTCYKDYYNVQTRSMVARRYEMDLEVFGYEW